MNKSRGQIAIEATIAIIAVFIFLLGAIQIFIWTNRNIVDRQKAYQASRRSLGSECAIDFYQPTEFSIFSQEDE